MEWIIKFLTEKDLSVNHLVVGMVTYSYLQKVDLLMAFIVFCAGVLYCSMMQKLYKAHKPQPPIGE